MVSKKALTMLLGAAASLGAAGYAAASTSAGSNGTIVLSLDAINATGTFESYAFDTGLLVNSGSTGSFNGNTSYSFTLNSATGSNFANFLANITAGEPVYISVVGGYTNGTNAVLDTTSSSSTGPKNPVANSGAGNSLTAIQTWLAGIAMTAGSDSYQTYAMNTGFYGSGQEGNWAASGGLGVTPSKNATGAVPLSTTLNFFNVTAAGQAGNGTTGNSTTTYAGTWEIVDNAGTYLLEYNAGSVPLPAPLLLLLSGLGLTGLIGRRGKSDGSITAVGAA